MTLSITLWITCSATVEKPVERFVDNTPCEVASRTLIVRQSPAGEVEGLSEERIAQVAIDFITFCFERRGAGWPSLYDEMCYVASNKLYRGLGYEELREVGLDLALSGLVKTSRIANEVARHVRIGDRPLREGLLVAS